MDANPNRKRRRKWLVLVVVVVLVLAVAGFVVYSATQNASCFDCGGIDYPVIQSAQAVTTGGKGRCQFVSTSAISWAAVCRVGASGGYTGTVTLSVVNRGNQGDGSDVDFDLYSSEPQYINFTSIPACAYTSAPSLIGETVCTVSDNSPSTFQFAFAVAQSYGNSSVREPASVTIVMYQTCCFP